MNTAATLSAIKTLLLASFDRVYIYPDDYASIALDPELPFVVIEENTGAVNNKAKYSGNCAFDQWQIRLDVFSADDFHKDRSARDATNMSAARTDRNEVMAILDNTVSLNGTVNYYGDDSNKYTHALAALQWNQKKKYTGSVFLIPVQT